MRRRKVLERIVRPCAIRPSRKVSPRRGPSMGCRFGPTVCRPEAPIVFGFVLPEETKSRSNNTVSYLSQDGKALRLWAKALCQKANLRSRSRRHRTTMGWNATNKTGRGDEGFFRFEFAWTFSPGFDERRGVHGDTDGALRRPGHGGRRRPDLRRPAAHRHTQHGRQHRAGPLRRADLEQYRLSRYQPVGHLLWLSDGRRVGT